VFCFVKMFKLFQCVPEKGMGFVPGAYRCVCEDGYFFPWPTSDVNAFTGQEIENFSRYSNNTFEKGKFQCNACEAGCDTCVDASPCLHQRHETLIITLMILNVLTVLGIIVISIGTYCYRNVTVII
jgi:G protein-coupled receptor 158